MFSSIIGTFDRIIKYHMWQAIVLVKGRKKKKNTAHIERGIHFVLLKNMFVFYIKTWHLLGEYKSRLIHNPPPFTHSVFFMLIQVKIFYFHEQLQRMLLKLAFYLLQSSTEHENKLNKHLALFT